MATAATTIMVVQCPEVDREVHVVLIRDRILARDQSHSISLPTQDLDRDHAPDQDPDRDHYQISVINLSPCSLQQNNIQCWLFHLI